MKKTKFKKPPKIKCGWIGKVTMGKWNYKTTKPIRIKARKLDPLWKVDFNPRHNGGMYIDIDVVIPLKEQTTSGIPVHYRARTSYYVPQSTIEYWFKNK